MAEPTTIIGLIFGLGSLIISNVAMWIREFKKHKTWKKNNGALDEIKATVSKMDKKVDCLDGKVGKARESLASIKSSVNSMQLHCSQTVSQFSKQISENSSKIFDLATKEKK